LVGIAISGLGEVSQNHYRGIISTENGELVGVFSHNRERADYIAKLWNVKPYHSYDEMLKDEKVEAVVICSADQHHYEQAIKAMKAGKHVLVEKPISLSLRDVVEMAKVSKEERVILFPVHNYIFRPKVLRARELILKKQIGEPTYALFIVTQRMMENVAKKYHGALFTQAYHSIYVSNYLLGPPKELYATWSVITYKEIKNDEVFVATFKYSNGGIGNIVANWAANDMSSDSWMWLDKIIGTRGVITISSFGDISYDEGASFMMVWAADYSESFVNLMKHFVDEVLAKGGKPIQTPYDAVLVHDIIENLKMSGERGERIEYKPPKLNDL